MVRKPERRYLVQKRRRWYAVLDIPKALRPKFGGKPRFCKSLKTESRTVADRVKWQVLAEWQRQLERARTGNEPLEFLLPNKRAMLDKADALGELKDWFIDTHIEITRSMGEDDIADATEIAAGRRHLLSEFQERWANRGQVQEGTKKQKLQKLKVLTRQFRYADEVTIRKLAEWIESDLVERQKIASGTLKNYFASWRDYWSYLQRWHGLEQQNPFMPDVLSDLQRLAKKPVQRQVWEPEEYWHLLSKLDKDDPLHALIQVAAHTGLRRQAICSLRMEDVLEDRFLIQKRKFETTSREFPIHTAILPLVERLKAASDGVWLFPVKGDDGRFARNMGERFRVYKNKLGYPQEKTLHSFRHTVATQLHKAQVAPHIVDLLLGWSVKGGSTGLRVYTKADFPAMKEAIERVKFTRV